MRWTNRTAARAALLLALRVGVAACAAAQTVAPGGSGRRELGRLSITTEVDSVRAQVRVTLALAGQLVGQVVLVPEAPVYRFDVAAGGAAAVGALSLVRGPAPGLSSLEGNLTTRTGPSPPAAFRGSVATWAWPESLPWASKRFWLTSELTVRTVVHGAGGTAATVTLYAGEVVLCEMGMTQAGPVAVVPVDLVLGDVSVTAGTSFTLTIATDMQEGQVFMQGRFRTRTTPETQIATAIATWAM